MFSIAVCDDDPEQLRKTGDFLHTYFEMRPSLSGQAVTFQSGSELLDSATACGGFDLYILDIIMPGLNGIETASKLRSLGDGGEIIYLTISNEYAADSYSVRAFFYLLKPVEKQRLFQVIDDAVEKLGRRRTEGIFVPVHGGTRRILLDRILYAERIGRIMRYYCADGPIDSLTFQSSFRVMAAPLLGDRRFCLCGSSFVFNLQHIAGISGPTVLLDNGVQVPIPRRSAPDVKAAWGRYWLNGGW